MGELGKLGAIGDERGLNGQFGGDAVAVFFDPVEAGKLRFGERATAGVPAGSLQEGLGVALEARTERGGEGADQAVVPFAEIRLAARMADWDWPSSAA